MELIIFVSISPELANTIPKNTNTYFYIIFYISFRILQTRVYWFP